MVKVDDCEIRYSRGSNPVSTTSILSDWSNGSSSLSLRFLVYKMREVMVSTLPGLSEHTNVGSGIYSAFDELWLLL